MGTNLPHPTPEAVPGIDPLEPRLHEVGIRQPNAADVVLAMSLEWGCGIEKAKRRLCAMNFEEVQLV